MRGTAFVALIALVSGFLTILVVTLPASACNDACAPSSGGCDACKSTVMNKTIEVCQGQTNCAYNQCGSMVPYSCPAWQYFMRGVPFCHCDPVAGEPEKKCARSDTDES
jgi:hypothetical protein